MAVTKFTDLIIKSLTPRIAPMVWVTMFVSVIIGFCFATGFLVGAGQSVLFTSGVLIPRHAWGVLLFVSSVVCEVGFATKKLKIVSLGGFVNFVLWLFASISLAVSGFHFALLTAGIFHTIFNGYVYLASSLGVLERESIYHSALDKD